MCKCGHEFCDCALAETWKDEPVMDEDWALVEMMEKIVE